MIVVPLLLATSPLAPPEPLAPFEPLQAVRPAKPKESKALSWTFAEVHVAWRSVDVVDDDVQGLGVRGATDLTDGFFLRGGLDFYTNDEDLTRYDLGIGHHVEIEKDVHAYASLSWVHAELDGAGGANSDEDGWRAEAGMRSVLDKVLEGEARIGYEDVGDDGFVYGADLRYWWRPNVALGIGYEREIDDDVITVGLRYAF